ncbi:hypothetical protein BDV10DRAFT_199702 [Aspergillus recurvatus]
MARRIHKKSRNGCLECKRRHVKCDERQPICSKCSASKRLCEYGSRFLSKTLQSPLTALVSQAPIRAHSASTTPASPESESQSQKQSPAAAPSSFPEQTVNMLLVELFHNLYTETYATFDPVRSVPCLFELIGHSITAPYLVNELLAFSALHMSTIRPHQRELYRYHAAQLQTHALSIFKETNPRVTHETCVPLFLFSAVLGIHVLCDTLIYRENDGDLPTFLGRFVHLFRIYHGVRIIIHEAWFMIEDTPLGPALNLGKDLYALNGHLGPGCSKLLSLILSANLAIESLQACLNVVQGSEDSDERHARIHGVMTWPLLLGIEFGDLLEQGRPEALVILAHYATLLHLSRDSWLFGNSGAFVIERVTGYLGAKWREWLAWPNEILEG